jgi:hypothetical protein
MERINDLLLDFVSPCDKYSLTFEDDGKVAYAYLKEGNKIVGDVWLYNRCETPEVTEWKDRNNIPFANCKGYMREEGRLEEPVGLEEVYVTWDSNDKGPVAYVHVLENLLGVVGVDDKPGCARFAIRDGPLAKIMIIED